MFSIFIQVSLSVTKDCVRNKKFNFFDAQVSELILKVDRVKIFVGEFDTTKMKDETLN